MRTNEKNSAKRLQDNLSAHVLSTKATSENNYSPILTYFTDNGPGSENLALVTIDYTTAFELYSHLKELFPSHEEDNIEDLCSHQSWIYDLLDFAILSNELSDKEQMGVFVHLCRDLSKLLTICYKLHVMNCKVKKNNIN